MVDEVELSDVEQRVYKAAVATESEGEPGTLHELAERTGLEVETTREALSRLTTSADLLREVPTHEPDLGPRYSVKGEPAPG